MRRGLLLIQRDYEILRYLTYGPATLNSIFLKFFDNAQSSAGTRKRVMRRRLSKLKESGLVEYCHSPRIAEEALVLTRPGAEAVAIFARRPIDRIWVHTPKPSTLYHDVLVANAARKILADSKAYNFSIDGMVFEFSIKSFVASTERNVRKRKGYGYPDFIVALRFADDSSREFAIEIDCATNSLTKIIAKIESSSSPFLLITETEARIDYLYTYIGKKNIKGEIFLTLTKKFFSTKQCFLLCDWWKPLQPAPVTIVNKAIFSRDLGEKK